MWILVAAWLAAFLVFSSFFMKTIVPLRIIAMVSNVAFIVRKGDVLFRQGEPADRLYLLQSGRVGFSELDKHVSAGALFGEVGLFAPHGVRTLTAACEEDCRFATISRVRVLELYYQNPKFGFFLIRLISGYVPGERGGDQAAMPART